MRILTEQELDNLQWVKDYLNNYEKKHGKRNRVLRETNGRDG